MTLKWFRRCGPSQAARGTTGPNIKILFSIESPPQKAPPTVLKLGFPLWKEVESTNWELDVTPVVSWKLRTRSDHYFPKDLPVFQQPFGFMNLFQGKDLVDDGE